MTMKRAQFNQSQYRVCRKTSCLTTWLVCTFLLLNLFQSAFINTASAHTHTVSAAPEKAGSKTMHKTVTTEAKQQHHAQQMTGSHCQQNTASGQSELTQQHTEHYQSVFTINKSDVAKAHIKANVDNTSPCCGDDCQCPSQHCFGSSIALLHPELQAPVSPELSFASTALVGARIYIAFNQYRPPKRLITV